MSATWVCVTVALSLKVNLLSLKTDTDVTVREAGSYPFERVASNKLHKSIFSHISVPMLVSSHAGSLSSICTHVRLQSLRFLFLTTYSGGAQKFCLWCSQH